MSANALLCVPSLAHLVIDTSSPSRTDPQVHVDDAPSSLLVNAAAKISRRKTMAPRLNRLLAALPADLRRASGSLEELSRRKRARLTVGQIDNAANARNLRECES